MFRSDAIQIRDPYSVLESFRRTSGKLGGSPAIEIELLLGFSVSSKAVNCEQKQKLSFATIAYSHMIAQSAPTNRSHLLQSSYCFSEPRFALQNAVRASSKPRLPYACRRIRANRGRQEATRPLQSSSILSQLAFCCENAVVF